MEDMQLTRSPDDRRLYALGDLGTLRLEGWTSRAAVARAGERCWQLRRGGVPVGVGHDQLDPLGGGVQRRQLGHAACLHRGVVVVTRFHKWDPMTRMRAPLVAEAGHPVD